MGNNRIQVANAELERCKQKLRESAIAYTAEAAEFGTKDGDAMAELESAALGFSTARTNSDEAVAEAEMEYIKGEGQ